MGGNLVCQIATKKEGKTVQIDYIFSEYGSLQVNYLRTDPKDHKDVTTIPIYYKLKQKEK